MKVLIVEDEPKIRRALKTLLVSINPAIGPIFEAENGEEGLELLIAEQPDLLLLDMIMPLMSGDELLGRIRKLEIEIPTIVVSGHHDFALVKQALMSGAIDYILKPFDKEDVEKALYKATERLEQTHFREQTNQLMQEMRTEQSKVQLQTVLKNIAMGHLYKQELDVLPAFVREEACLLHLIVIRNYEVALHERYNKDIALFDYALHKCIGEFAELQGVELLTGVSGHYDWCLWMAIRGRDEEKFQIERLEQVLFTVLKLSCFVWRHGEKQQLDGYAKTIAELESRILYANLIQDHPSGAAAVAPRLVVSANAFVARAAHTIQHRLSFRIKADVDELFRYAEEQQQLTVMYLFQVWMNMNTRADVLISPQAKLSQPLDRVEAFALAIAFHTDQAKLLLTSTIEEYIAIYQQVACADKRKGNRILAVKEYIDFSYSESLSLANLAQHFFISKEYLATQFKQQFGMTLVQYIHSVRLKQAKILLEEGQLAVSEVAATVGYDHFSYFGKRFKGLFGVTPSEYRILSEKR